MKRVDRNQPEIVRDLRKAGASVQVLSAVGHGCVDLLVGFRGLNFCLEIKDWSAKPSQKRLTPDERQWHDEWQGQCAVVETSQEALLAIGAIK